MTQGKSETPTPSLVHNAQGEFEGTIGAMEKAEEAARMRSMRMSYPQIAKAQGCSQSTAYRRVQAALAAVPVEAVTELRAISGTELEWIAQQLRLAVADTKASRSERTAALRELRLTNESYRRLTGQDIPVTQRIEVSDGWMSEIARLEAELAIGAPEGANSGSE